MLGGGMRQAGIIAAGALHALEHHRTRLVTDHANARALAEGLGGLDGVRIDPDSVETNIVLFDVTAMPAGQLVAALAEAGVAVLATGPDQIRAVTNLTVGPEDIVQAVATIRQLLGR
jgi:threonine aldolase